MTPPETSTRSLSFDKARREYIGEISSTSGFGPVNEDSSLLGMTLVGKTGRKVVFAIDDRVDDADGDVAFWILRPVAVVGTDIASVIVRLFND